VLRGGWRGVVAGGVVWVVGGGSGSGGAVIDGAVASLDISIASLMGSTSN
jgi:hypothetical protein